MKINNRYTKPTPQDIKLFKLIRAILSKSEFDTLLRFYKEHEALSTEEKNNLMLDELPEIYDKLTKIGGCYENK